MAYYYFTDTLLLKRKIGTELLEMSITTILEHGMLLIFTMIHLRISSLILIVILIIRLNIQIVMPLITKNT